MSSTVKYIHELPYKPRSQLCRILDADRRWEELGGNYMKYDVTTLTLIGQALQRDKSPTSELLNKYSEKNGTIERLFIWLYKMDHQRAMSILEPYVDEKYHGIRRNTYSTSFLGYSSKQDIPRPSESQFSIPSTNGLSQVSQVSSTHKHISGAYGTSSREKENFSSKNLKLDNNANINQNYSSNSLRSKSLNVPHMEPKVIAKKSPNLNQSKKNSLSKQESISDNCIPEKMKNSPRKPSVQEMFFNGKQLKHNHSGANNFQDDSLPDFMNIPYSEILKATDNFSETRVLGKGGFGTVYKGEWKGTSVAIKRLSPKRSDSPSRQHVSLKQTLNELNILKCCRFDHILPLYAISISSDGANPCLIYQLMVNGSLEDRLLCKNKTPPLTWYQRSHIAECTAKGLNYLHTTCEKPLVHGDIKSANILLDANMEAKIGDFGLTREGPNCDHTHVKVTSVHGTECYLPEEYLRWKKLSPQVDIYCYGIVMLEIATGLRPYDLQTKKKLVEHVKACDDAGRLDSLRDVKAGEENMLWFRELIDIGRVCSSVEKKKRPPMQEVLSMFEKAKNETSMMDKIRRPSNERVSQIDDIILSPLHLTPMQLQQIYDLKKEGQRNASENNKILNIFPDNVANSAIPLVIEQMKNVSVNTKKTEPCIKSLKERTSFISSEGSISSEIDSSTVSEELPNKDDSTPDGNVEPETKVPPIPLMSILQMRVSELEKNSDGPHSQKSLSSSKDIKV